MHNSQQDPIIVWLRVQIFTWMQATRKLNQTVEICKTVIKTSPQFLTADLTVCGWGERCDWSSSSTRGRWGWAGGGWGAEQPNATENHAWAPSPARASLSVQEFEKWCERLKLSCLYGHFTDVTMKTTDEDDDSQGCTSGPPLHVVSTYEAGLWAWRQVCAAAALPPFGTASRWHSQSPASSTARASQQSCHLESGCTRGSTASCSKAGDGAWPGAEDEMLGCLLGEGAARPACLHVFLFSIPPAVHQFGSPHRELCRWRAPACWGHPQCKPCAP